MNARLQSTTSGADALEQQGPEMQGVTIVICNYNYAAYLRGAIDSALTQSTAAAVMVIDDGSTDDSRDILASYGARITRVFQENGGQVAAYNHALQLIDTPYVIFLDADDVLYPDAVKQVEAAFATGDYVKVQFKLEVMTSDGERTGVTVPQSGPVENCGRLLRAGWLYPSPPGSGNAYKVDALRQFFPVPVTPDNVYGADFYAIYGVVLLGNVRAIDGALGGYRVHRAGRKPGGGTDSTAAEDLAFSNSEDSLACARKAAIRWRILRDVVGERLEEQLPPAFLDFSAEKALFGDLLYHAPHARRRHWFTHESGRYFHTVLANPFWSVRKKLAVSCLTAVCLVPFASISDRAVRYIANPLARAGH